jgi:sensor histidine kinase YesM
VQALIWLIPLLPFLGLGVGMAGNALADKERRREQHSRQNRELSKLEYEAEKLELEARIKAAKGQGNLTDHVGT